MRRKSGFYPSVSASKNSVPDSDVRDRFDDWVGGRQFGPFQPHHPVFRYRTLPDTPAFVPRYAGFSSPPASPNQSPRDEYAFFTPPSLHQKIPFLTRMSETGSTTGWGVGSSVHSSPTIQSSRTGYFPVRFRFAVCAGISAIGSGPFGSLRASSVSGGVFGAFVSASENPVPGGQGSQADMGFVVREPDSGGVVTSVFWRRRAIVVGSNQALRTAAPFRRSLTQPLDVDASRQTTLDGGADP
jgi:hypothetical protein